MSGIERKSIGLLVDELITTSMKCWFSQEGVNSEDDATAVKSARDAQSLNARRNALIRAIDARLGEGAISPTGKTYTHDCR